MVAAAATVTILFVIIIVAIACGLLLYNNIKKYRQYINIDPRADLRCDTIGETNGDEEVSIYCDYNY